MPEPTPLDDLELLKEACLKAGSIAMGYFGNQPHVTMKPGNSPVTEADLAVDDYLRDFLHNARPDYGWLSEETPDDLARLNNKRCFIVDPIDGTRDFIRGGDVWCVSIAVVENGRPFAGVLNCPVRQQQLCATIDGKATLNGAMLVRNQRAKAPLRVTGQVPAIKQMIKLLGEDVDIVTDIPSLAYRIAMIALGKLDAALVKPKCHDWDIAAAELILNCAGGVLLDAQGQQIVYGQESVARDTLIAGMPETVEKIMPVAHQLGFV